MNQALIAILKGFSDHQIRTCNSLKFNVKFAIVPIIYETEQQVLKVDSKKSLLVNCLKNAIDIDHSCEGMASCGTCRIVVTQGLENLPPRNELEEEMAIDRNFSPKERLACQLYTSASFQFYLPKDKEE